MTTTLRAQLLSSAEHTLAVAKLGSDYDAETYLQTIDLIRATGGAEQYVDRVLGVDVAELLRGVEEEADDVVKAAERSLRGRGIDPAKASYREFADALIEAAA